MNSTFEQPLNNSAFTNNHFYFIHTLYNFETPQNEWLTLNFNQAFNQREKTFIAFNISNYKIGKTTSLANRLTCLNREIPLDWLNYDKIKYKLLCKQKCLPYVG